MKQGYRFVDCDMHIMEPPDLFDKYLDPAFKHRITSSMRRSDGGPDRHARPAVVVLRRHADQQ